MLISLIAPRPVYIGSAAKDLGADPVGEYLSLKAASPVYELYSNPPFAGPEMPSVQSPILGRMGHHIRNGRHDIVSYDWDRYMDFADQFFK